MCLNPYCSGRKNRIFPVFRVVKKHLLCLNPYCSGRKNRISPERKPVLTEDEVLILIVVEERIGLDVDTGCCILRPVVLILIVVEERIGFCLSAWKEIDFGGLNPYCSGRKNRILPFRLLN